MYENEGEIPYRSLKTKNEGKGEPSEKGPRQGRKEPLRNTPIVRNSWDEMVVGLVRKGERRTRSAGKKPSFSRKI